jgi:hypothetical protein
LPKRWIVERTIAWLSRFRRLMRERGLDPQVCRLFIIDGAKALSQVHPSNLRSPHADPALPDS